MKIDFVVRSDAPKKAGGDSVQVDEYLRYFESMGYSVRVLPFSPTMIFRSSAAVHVVNVDRPFDFLVTCKLAGTRPIFVSPIHHSLHAIREMRDAERGLGLRSLVGRIFSETGREYLATMVRMQRDATTLRERVEAAVTSARSIRLFRRVWSAVGEALDRAVSVFILAEGERLTLMADTGWRGENSVSVPNGRPAILGVGHRGWEARSTEILIVGRIEPRKRQLDILRAARDRAIPVTMVGPLNAPDSPFGRTFQQELSEQSIVRWTGALSPVEVFSMMQNSKILLNASWVEVQSLVDIEAAVAGCWVVCSAGSGNSAEGLAGSVVQVNSREPTELLRACVELLAQAPPKLDAPEPWTWEDAAARIAQSYLLARSHVS